MSSTAGASPPANEGLRSERSDSITCSSFSTRARYVSLADVPPAGRPDGLHGVATSQPWPACVRACSMPSRMSR